MSSEGPPGPLGELLVGHVWTPQSDLSITSVASTKRKTTSTVWHHFSDQLRQTLSGPLDPGVQKGMTADDIRDTFKWCANQAGDVAETNGVVSQAYTSAHDSAAELNSKLATIADDGHSRIQTIQNSKSPAPIKLGQIVEVVMDCQQQANSAAAPHAQNIFEAMQTVLDRRGIPKSARQFAQEHGIDPYHMLGSPDRETVSKQVQGFLDRSGAPQASGAGELPSGMVGSNIKAPESPAHGPANPPPAMVGHNPTAPEGPAPASANPPPGMVGQNPTAARSPAPAPAAPAPAPVATGSAGGGMPTPSAPSVPTTGISNTPVAAPVSASSLGAATPSNNFMHGFEQGLQATAPASPGLNAVPPPVMSPVDQQLPAAPPATDAPAPTFSASAHVPAFDAPPPATDATISTHAPAPEPATTYVAGPAAAATPMTSSPPPMPAGPLPTYGADIRPAASAVPSPPTAPSAPPPAAPASAPVNPSTGAGGIAQPVVRQPSAVPTPPPAPATVGEQMVVATAGGSAAGAASAHASAQARLQRLVDFVARQEPRLRWAAGDRSDGTTVLVTDLASGWIPPNIAIPSGMQLLDPAPRRGDIESLLGEVTVTAGYAPLHYLPPADDAEPIASSSRARQGPVVDELGWELGQATKWRDGLPRLAHTLAKAASTGTGVLDSEIELLNEHLAKVAEQVLNSYPENVDPAALANWQLLAAIDALVATDKIAANYHFAWFQALSNRP